MFSSYWYNFCDEIPVFVHFLNWVIHFLLIHKRLFILYKSLMPNSSHSVPCIFWWCTSFYFLLNLTSRFVVVVFLLSHVQNHCIFTIASYRSIEDMYLKHTEIVFAVAFIRSTFPSVWNWWPTVPNTKEILFETQAHTDIIRKEKRLNHP